MVSIKREMPVFGLKYRGVFDMDGLYRTIQSWLEGQGYEFHEQYYKHKVPSPLGYEQEVGWYGKRKSNAYVRFWIYVHFHIWDMKDVEVVRDGKKKKMLSGRMQMEMDGYVELDWQNMFSGNKFLEYLQDWMNKYVLFNTITGGWEDELYYRIHKLYYVVKDYLNMETAHNASAHRY